jgi:hypothetical protein
MLTNPKKSGILIPQCAISSPPTHILNYPVVHQYKHLGFTMNNKLDASIHLSNIQSKITFITHRLTPIRLRNNGKLNLNLFKTLISPLYRLAIPAIPLLNNNANQLFFSHFRKNFKRFMNLPRNCSNRMVDLLTNSP